MNKADREKLISKANMVAPSILSGAATRKEVSKEWVATATAIGGGIMAALSVLTVAGPIIGSTWLSIIIFRALAKELAHLKSDVTTSMGLPAPLMSLFNLLQFGSVGEEEQTIAEIVQGMYYEGYDFIQFCSSSIFFIKHDAL